MSSGKLNQSLDEILKDNKSGRRTSARPRRGAKPGTKAAAPVGGIKKSTKPARNVARQPPAKTLKPTTVSEILVENLVSISSRYLCHVDAPLTPSQPKDVNEAQLKVCYR